MNGPKADGLLLGLMLTCRVYFLVVCYFIITTLKLKKKKQIITLLFGLYCFSEKQLLMHFVLP